MKLGDPIKIRLPLESHLLYEREAERLGKPLATYIRERLELHDRIDRGFETLRAEFLVEMSAARHEIASLQLKSDNREPSAHGNGLAPGDRATLIELLLVLRANCPPDRLAMIHAELERLGLEVWTYNSKRH